MVRPFLAVAILLPLLPHGGSSEPDSRCTIAFDPLLVTSSTTFLLGTPRSDSLYAGNGLVEPTGTGGHLTPSIPDRSVYGQMFELEAIGGSGATEVSRTLGEWVPPWREERVAVVVWDYDAGCDPSKWGESFVWAPLGSASVLLAMLRPETHWARPDIPTFDAFYGGRLYPGRELPTHSGGWLPARTVFNLLRSLPDVCAYYHEPDLASKQLRIVGGIFLAEEKLPPASWILERQREWLDGSQESQTQLDHMCAP